MTRQSSLLMLFLAAATAILLVGNTARAQDDQSEIADLALVGPEAEPDTTATEPDVAQTEPDAADSEATPQDQDGEEPQTETIRERFPNGSVKIERETIQDAQENYVNHGSWKMWDQRGNKVAEGSYQDGKREGEWVSWFIDTSGNLLSEAPFDDFPAPFISKATFRDGTLHGKWIIYDSKQRKISQWSFKDGVRNGTWTWWYSNGRKMRELTYHDGDIEGELTIRTSTGQVQTKHSFVEGRRLANKVDYYDENQKKSQGVYLLAKRVAQSNDDWWNARLATLKTEGKDQRHGPWIAWHKNGQVSMKGQFRYDEEVGLFTWYHTNGQKAVSGKYDAGKRTGPWVWWHPNGQKSTQGEFAKGDRAGKWTFWDPKGKVSRREDFSGSEVQIVTKPSTKAMTHQRPTADKQAPRLLVR